MSLIQEIVKVVEQKGRADLYELAPMFPAYTQRQVMVALHNATYKGRIVKIEQGRSRGNRKGFEPSIYGPRVTQAEPSRLARVSSVFDLGAAA